MYRTSKKRKQRAQNAEHRLVQAQRMQTVGTLASGIAHDFKNVLVPILGRSELAEGGGKQSWKKLKNTW